MVIWIEDYQEPKNVRRCCFVEKGTPHAKGCRFYKEPVIHVPDKLWVMAMSGHTMVGGFNHVSQGEVLYTSEEACQKAIDTMPGWVGMGDRKRYFPLLLIRAEQKAKEQRGY